MSRFRAAVVGIILAIGMQDSYAWLYEIHSVRSSPRINLFRDAADDEDAASNFLEDGQGHINRELAETIYAWEQKHREPHLPKFQFSTRQGLRLVDELVEEQQALNPRTTKTDLIQEGVVALLQAMSSYRGENTHFEDYARAYIGAELTKALDKQRGPMRLPKRVTTTVERARQLLNQGQKAKEVAQTLDISMETLELYFVLSRGSLSMESTIEIYDPHNSQERYTAAKDTDDTSNSGANSSSTSTTNTNTVRSSTNDNDDEEEYEEGADEMWLHQEQIVAPLVDSIADTDEPSPDDMALQEMIRHDVDEFLTHNLDETQLEILRRRFGFFGKQQTKKTIAKEMGMPYQEVRRIQEEALEKLRHSYETRYVETYLDGGPYDIEDSV